MKLKIHAGQVNQMISGDVVNISEGAREDKLKIQSCMDTDASLRKPALASQVPTRNSVRILLSEILISSIDLDAFCMDYFPDVYQLFSAGMQVEERRNLLLWRIPPEMILSCLLALHPQKIKAKEHLLVYE